MTPDPQTPITGWQAARTHPHTYPGRHPAANFALVDDVVVPFDDLADIEVLLRDRGLTDLAGRHPVVAYGGNRNPATLALKMTHYGYRSGGTGLVLPVLTGRLPGFDVVGAGLSAQGYLYADLYRGVETAATELAVHVLLLDDDQLRVVHDSEGVRSEFYDVAALSGVTLDTGRPIPALAYLARAPAFVSPSLATPLAFAAVRATGRRTAAFEALPMLAHALWAAGLVEAVRAVVGGPGVAPDGTGADADDEADAVAWQLMRYLNGQWWWRQHTGSPRISACDELETMIRARLEDFSTAGGGRPPADDVVLLGETEAYATTGLPTFGTSDGG